MIYYFGYKFKDKNRYMWSINFKENEYQLELSGKKNSSHQDRCYRSQIRYTIGWFEKIASRVVYSLESNSWKGGARGRYIEKIYSLQ